MKLKIIHKIILWTLSFLMVFNFLTFNIYFDLFQGKIKYNETQLVTESDATFQEAIYFVLYYLFASLMVGAGTDNTKVITDYTLLGLYDRYQTWYAEHDAAQNGGLKTLQQNITEYIDSVPAAQSQINEMNQFVVPSYLMDDVVSLWQDFELETTNYASYGYSYFNTYLNKQMYWFQPSLTNMQLGMRGATNMVITFMPISYGNGPSFYIINGLDFTTTKSTLASQSQLRIRIRDKNGVQRYDLYSEKYNVGSLFDTAQSYMLAVEHVTSTSTLGDLYIFPLNSEFTDKYEIFTNRLKVNCVYNSCSTSRTQVMDTYMNYAYIGSSGTYLDNGGGIPDTWQESDYYYVPIVPPGTIETPINVTPPIPVPDEDENDYIPPVPVPGDTSGDWTNIGNPSTPAPSPTVDNLADGTFFENVANWFASIWTSLVNSVMGFWDAFVKNLWKVWDDMVKWWAQLIPDDWFKGFWDDFITNMMSLFIPSDLDLKFNTLLTYFEDKFGLLFYGIELLVSFFNRVVNTTPRDSIQLFAFSIDGIQIIPNYEFNFTEFASQNEFLLFIYQAMKSILTALLILGFFYGVYSKYESMRDH